jgi:hypothetical protein
VSEFDPSLSPICDIRINQPTDKNQIDASIAKMLEKDKRIYEFLMNRIKIIMLENQLAGNQFVSILELSSILLDQPKNDDR